MQEYPPVAVEVIQGLRQAVEAIVLVVDNPVSEQEIAQVLEVSTAQVRHILEQLASEYAQQQRGFQLREVDKGWRFFTHPQAAAYVERFVSESMVTRLTGAAMETLAVVAYRQPVTRSQIAGIRGVNVDGVMRTLLSRGLVEEAGAEPLTGAHYYRTTAYFLERMGLTSLEQLPEIVPHLRDTAGLEEQSVAELDLRQHKVKSASTQPLVTTGFENAAVSSDV